MKQAVLLIGTILLIWSCDRHRVYEQFVTVKDQTWNSKDIVHFNVNISDTASAHNVYIAVRSTGQYEYSNLFMFVTAYSPNGSKTRDTTEVVLANEHGKWLGKGSAAVYTLYYPYRQNVRFPLRGIYQFDIEQAMWIRNLKHVSHIGLCIEKVSNRK